jgi:hypothetical protein
MPAHDRISSDRPPPAQGCDEGDPGPVRVGERLEQVVRSTPVRSGYVSLVAHLVLAILLAVFAIRPEPPNRLRPLVLGFSGDTPRPEVVFEAAVTIDTVGSDKPAEQPSPDDLTETGDRDTQPAQEQPDAAAPDASPELTLEPVETVAADAAHLSLPAEASAGTPITSVSTSTPLRRPQKPPRPRSGGVSGGVTGVPFANRSAGSKREAVRQHGGTAASEQAVARGLEWLASHQGPDGSWRCDLANSRCRGGCRNPGSISGSIGPTALALLPFLGAGSTHLDGPHQATVSRGLYYLATNIRPGPRGGDLCEGSMYAHGIAVLAMAEAYGMTNDDFLEPLLKETVRFTETSQDLHGGGWRYLPGQAGDTTVSGWQVVSLKSAAMAGIPIRSPTLDGVRRFLDSVQSQGGAAYGYRTPAAKPSTSAVGLLARMYTGWTTDEEPLWRGMTQLAARGPDPNAIYENFYLAQVLMQADHPVWPRWNAANRDQIIRQQAVHGHETGSWFFADPDSAPGGRLAHTALAILTLEVYYRLLPIYGEQAVDGGF